VLGARLSILTHVGCPADVPDLSIDPFGLVGQQKGRDGGQVSWFAKTGDLGGLHEHLLHQLVVLPLLGFAHYEAGHDAIASNTLRTPVIGDMTRELVDGAQRSARRGVDDAAATLVEQMRQDRTRRAHVAEQVDVERAVPYLEIGVQKRLIAA